MGFKCPICFDDFGFDKPKWSEHLKTAHEGCGEDIVNAVLKITDEPKDEDENENELSKWGIIDNE